MMNLSKYVLENELQYVSRDDVLRIFQDYLQPRNLGVTGERLLEIVIQRSGILVVDAADGRICFKHRTFAEFLYAQYSMKHRSLKVDNRVFRFYWLNTYYFYVGLLRDCPELLEEIAGLIPKGDGERLIRLINMGNFLMAAYTSPYAVISKILTLVVADAATHYVGILRRTIKSPLSHFSPMHLLWLLQFIIRDSYSYEFLVKALESAALEVKLGTMDDETKSYALFFLDLAYRDAGGGDAFKFLLDGHIKTLPFTVQLAIGHESDAKAIRTSLVKNVTKGLQKAMRGNRVLQREVFILYKHPIRSLK